MKFPKTLRDKIKLFRIVNDGISIVILVFAGYLLFAPYFPEVSYAFSHLSEKPPLDESLSNQNIPLDVMDAAKKNKTMLFIPDIEVTSPIIEAERIEDIHENIWRRPLSSTPPSGGNTVFVAHRYATIGGNRASTFYHLPKLVEGNDIFVTWGGKIYHYQVSMTEIVLPDDISIEGRTSDSELTLYTCTPLWKADKRFVAHALLIEIITL